MRRNQRRAVIVFHGLADANAAADAFAGRPLTLITLPGAGATVGPGWFLAVEAMVREAHPGADIDMVFDCDDLPGHVLAALRRGVKRIVFTGRGAVRAKLIAIAEAQDAEIFARPRADLDLGAAPDREAALTALLKNF